MDNKYITEKKVLLSWKNNSDGLIILEQNTLNTKITIDNEETNTVFFDMDDTQIRFEEKNGMRAYFWNTNEYQFLLYITDDDLSTDDVIDLIRSIMRYE